MCSSIKIIKNLDVLVFRFFLMLVWSLFIIGLMGLFFYNKIGSIIPMVVLPTTEIIEPFIAVYKDFLRILIAFSSVLLV
ncbi:hypothetical protein HMPREF3112_05605 [Streptococcus sp. HMSC10E12]|jgi:DNA polymerase IV|nr:hypothetical protein HMPREF3112_05605 [Streptococcus sp. HMSC10E12]PPA32920.1 hypothetical protein CGZ74_05570 [Streptococcus salivarius]RGW03512.1 hypothetical protein DWV94_06075 [Streptococcus salivarius]